jgi:hypothetical protein
MPFYWSLAVLSHRRRLKWRGQRLRLIGHDAYSCRGMPARPLREYAVASKPGRQAG